MRAVPMLTPNPGTGRALPTPQVKSAVVRQVVDLKPAGATIAIRTVADNPFESSKPVSIVTQASGGMSPAPQSMQSRRIMHSMMPGIGSDVTSTKSVNQASSPTGFQAVASTTLPILDFAAQTYQQMDPRAREAATRQEEARARIAEAEASQARWQASQMIDPTTRQGAMTYGTVGLLAVAGLVAYMMLRK